MLDFEQFLLNISDNTYKQLKSHFFLLASKFFISNKSLLDIKQHIKLQTIFFERQ